MNTKMVLTALGLAALVATPAFAQKPTPRTHVSAPAASLTGAVVYDGRVIGADPDAQIRSELARDASTYSSTN